MFRKNKTETIPFRDFMSGNHRTRKKTSPSTTLYSYGGFYVSPFSVFDTGTLIIAGVGIATIALTMFEKSVLRTGDFEKADSIGFFGHIALMLGIGGAAVWFLIFKNPIGRFL
jgi:hypothetical protein